jgi:hypothetical protein
LGRPGVPTEALAKPDVNLHKNFDTLIWTRHQPPSVIDT